MSSSYSEAGEPLVQTLPSCNNPFATAPTTQGCRNRQTATSRGSGASGHTEAADELHRHPQLDPSHLHRSGASSKAPHGLSALLKSWQSCDWRPQQLLPTAQSPVQFSKSRSGTAAVMAAGHAATGPVLTGRAVAAGLLVGSVLCFSNTYFGLQTGWVTMGSLQSAILGYGLFQGLGAVPGLLSRQLSAGENVIVQTTAVATATMPLAAGLVGIIPALGLLTPDEHPSGPVTFTPWQLLAWCSALAFFGVFVAVPLRHQTIIREKLRFPSGTATASVIRTLHGLPQQPDELDYAPPGNSSHGSSSSGSGSAGAAGSWLKHRASDEQPGSSDGMHHNANNSSTGLGQVDLEVAVWAEGDPEQTTLLNGQAGAARVASGTTQQQEQWARGLRLLLWCFALSGAYSLAAAWVKPLKVLKVFDWIHLPAATVWGWVLQPSAGYIGQGMIMGPKTAWSMMAGALTGWAVLGPLAKSKGWAPGPIKDVETGAAGWLMWLGLALLLGDCFSELALLIGSTVYEKAFKGTGGSGSWSAMAPTDGPASLAHRAVGYQQIQNAAAASYSQQQQVGLRSRNGSRNGLAGSSLELIENGSNGSEAEPGSTDSANSQDALSTSGGVLVPIAAASQSPQHRHHLQQPSEPRAAARAFEGQGDSGDAQAWLLSAGFWVPGLLLSTALATAVLSPMLSMPFYEPLVAVIVALLVALLAVRALGQTDLNPVSGVGKVSQLAFAVVSPGAVLPNLVAGAIAEAGAQQAGDLMQDFKTAHLLGVPPSSQLVAMLLGSAASVPLSVAAYLLYTHAWQVPGPELPAPTAQIWLDMAKLVNGGHLPEHIGPFCAAAAAIAAALPVLQLLLRQLQQASGSANKAAGQRAQQQDAGVLSTSAAAHVSFTRQAAARLWSTWRHRTAVDWVLALLPSGVGFAVGMYLTPNWTVPRLLGSVVEQTWLLLSPHSHSAFMMVAASGLVLGEGCASVVTAVVQAIVR